jgi:hypothetical protein
MKRLYVWFDAVIGYLSRRSSGPGGSAGQTPGSSGGSIRKPAAAAWARTTSSSILLFGPAYRWDTTERETNGGTVGALGDLRLPDDRVE